ncbi:hypothetical protein AAF712_009988 [Marasmius tenuissimus]|uniref:Uncharacterized protein n=1 Tax=Marasmius tenuissimus TaxID=585030 RepID=A0ABR2ZN29_9AGAR
MPPPPSLVLRSAQTASEFSAVKEQWKNPDDILTVLMIIGDVVKAALAQLTSSDPRPFTPVAFSFGWVAFSFSTILSVMGSRRLVPDPDCRCTLIDVKMGYPRDVSSWVLARLVRDYEPSNTGTGLEVAFFGTVKDKRTGVPERDWVYYLGACIILLQLILAALPGVLDGNWTIMIITCAGTLLAQIQGALPQWRKELWNARKIEPNKREVVCLTRGNGSSYVMVISSEGDEVYPKLKLADIAGGREVCSKETTYATFVLVVLWFAHLLTMQGVESGHWYTLAIGAAGMLQNVIAAGARRDPSALGFHLEHYHTVHQNKVFEALKEAEERERRVGFVLLDIFFPGGLMPLEEQWKERKKEEYKQK